MFCQDDLWNWFHREPEPDAEEDSDSFESFDSQSGDDSSSDESAESDHGTGGQSTATRLGNLPTQTGARQSAHVPGTVARQSNDLVTVEDDYNTDDSFVDTASSKSSSPVAVRGGYRIQTTRGEQVAAYRASLASRRPERQVSATATAPITSAVNGSTSNDVARTARMSEQPLTPGRPLRVPALERPRRKNLVCPQCRSHIALPPFPVFALRGVTDLLAAQTAGRRAQSIEAEREGNNIVDGTWGGLFSTGVR